MTTPDSPPSPVDVPGRRPSWLASTFFTVSGNLVLALATGVFGVAASILGWLPPRGRWMYLCARMWSHALLRGSGVRLRSTFEVPLEADHGFIYMANHQSMYDIPALIAGMPGEVRFLAKKGLFSIPVFGWALSAGGFVPVDRGNRRAAMETYEMATRILRQGRSILIFPEQTRSDDGNLLPFKRGGVVLALKTGFPIVPVGIRGTRKVRPKGSIVVHPGTVEVRYGLPILLGETGTSHDVGLDTDREALRKAVGAAEGDAPVSTPTEGDATVGDKTSDKRDILLRQVRSEIERLAGTGQETPNEV